MVTNNYLFVYGTLLDDDNEFGSYLKNNCSFYAGGKFKGRLYDIGEYPGAVADTDSTGYVYGSIYLMNNAEKILARLDDYEGFGEGQEKPNLFVRERIDAETDDETITCWCYLYNLTVDGLRIIENGDYKKNKFVMLRHEASIIREDGHRNDFGETRIDPSFLRMTKMDNKKSPAGKPAGLLIFSLISCLNFC